ncbi:SIMPL domain-containing protein [Microbacterium caowuchunii]|uniref:SIMPL domain-containing protein n=1 Tax=Microbacterium caowuchunii TaxID=2614638 RepID=UPI0012459025|nr:SIMPL domain-containing protein [Microbacterium caowuchunii]QEV99702.1 SIMPL domain-containing protein [Microbacterium caowuchunii]
MSDVTVTVRGEHEERIPAEQGVVRVTVHVEGRDRGTVVEQLAALATPVRADLDSRQSAGALLRWTSSRANVWTERPWGPDGARLAPVQHASVEITATFTDPAALSAWVDDLARRDGTQVDGVAWELSDTTAAAARDRVSAAAVRDAVERATAYAAALGLHTVVPLAVADTGLLSPDSPPAAPRMLRAMAVGGAESGMDLRPEDITVSASVEARFLAR